MLRDLTWFNCDRTWAANIHQGKFLSIKNHTMQLDFLYHQHKPSSFQSASPTHYKLQLPTSFLAIWPPQKLVLGLNKKCVLCLEGLTALQENNIEEFKSETEAIVIPKLSWQGTGCKLSTQCIHEFTNQTLVHPLRATPMKHPACLVMNLNLAIHLWHPIFFCVIAADKFIPGSSNSILRTFQIDQI